MTSQEKYYLDLLITNALTIDTDEIEGLLTIDLNNLNLCDVDYAKTDQVPDISISDDDILKQLYADKDFWKLISSDDPTKVLNDIKTDEKVIIEFAEPTIKNPYVLTYNISVNPGEELTEETIIGSIVEDGKTKKIKSIFQKGTVKSTDENNTSFFLLFPSRCTRHIILENTLAGNGSDFDIHTDLERINEMYKKEGILYSLIVNNMCESLLPYVLSHRYRGVYTRKDYGHNQYSKWYLDTSDLSYDGLDISTFIYNKEFKNSLQYDTSLFIFDIYNDSLNTGVAIFDTSIMKELHEIKDVFAADMLGSGITNADMKSWRRRARKKRNRRSVRKEITRKTELHTNSIKRSPNPYEAVQNEGNRLLGARTSYIDKVILLYKDKEKLPLCKYDPEYTDCKFLINEEIDGDVYDNAHDLNDEFSFGQVGDEDYYNYYMNLLSNINMLIGTDDEYVLEFYLIISDIIDKRMIIEERNYIDLIKSFMYMFNDNIKDMFTVKKKSDAYIIQLFNQLENKAHTYNVNSIKQLNESIAKQFKKSNLDDEALSYATVQDNNSDYQKIYNYINSLIEDGDSDEGDNNVLVMLLSTMYTYLKQYGNGSNNPYKNIKIEDEKYVYLGLVLEEAKRITDFWDKVLDVYFNNTLDKCIEETNKLAHSFDEFACWPVPTEVNINNVAYKHYLFEYQQPKDISNNIDISIGDYNFPDHVDFPDIIDDYAVDEDWALNELRNPVLQDPDDPNAITFLDFLYWLKYFALATLICLPFLNCGLDIPPFILMIPLPCIFIAFTSVYIPMFNLLIVFGIAIRGMYPWPVILYLNTSNQPISILTPLVAILDLLKDTFYSKINNLEDISIQTLVNSYINKLNKEINDLKKENRKLNNFKTVIKDIKLPHANSIQETFALIVDPSIDTRQRIQRIETLARKSRIHR